MIKIWGATNLLKRSKPFTNPTGIGDANADWKSGRKEGRARAESEGVRNYFRGADDANSVAELADLSGDVEEKIADILTKALSEDSLNKLCLMLGVNQESELDNSRFRRDHSKDFFTAPNRRLFLPFPRRSY